ncbi:MAG: hypothetical protein IK066_09125 [Kiritimatiellae bacterium]|nr:hypothetical protein [Kiritimatiellia bacterium]
MLTFRQRQSVFWSVLLRALLLVLGLLLLLYGAAQLVARSNFFRESLQRRLSAVSGLPLRIDGRVRATEDLNLKIRNVIGVQGAAGLSVDTLRIRWTLFPPPGASPVSRVWLEGLRLTFSVAPDGTVSPDFLGALAHRAATLTGLRDAVPGLPDLPPAPLPNPTPSAPPTPSAAPPAYGDADNPWSLVPLVRVQNASLHWRDASSNEIAFATGVDFTWNTWPIPPVGMMPLLTADDVSRVSYLRAYAAHVRVGTSHVTGLRLELIQAGDTQYLVLLDAEDWGTLAPPLSPSASAAALFRDFFPDDSPAP